MKKLEYQFLLSGTESAAAKLKGIEALNQSLVKGLSSDELFRATQGNFSKSMLALNPQLQSMFKDSGKKAAKAFEDGRFEAMQDLARRGNSQAMINQVAAIAMQDWKINNPGGKPPILAAGGAGGGGFIGRASILGGAFFGGPLGAGIAALGTSFVGLAAAGKLAREAFDKLIKTINDGARLYADAAKLGISPSKTFQLQYALNANGISPDQANLLALYGEFPRGMTSSGRGGVGGGRISSVRGMAIGVEGQELGAGRGVRQVGELQQVSNLWSTVRRDLHDAATDAFIVGENAKRIFDFKRTWLGLKREWDTLWNELAADLATIFGPLLSLIKNFLKTINEQIAMFKLGMSFFFGGSKQPDNQRFVQGARIPANEFQRMGFVFGTGNFSHNPMQETAQNTKKIAVNTQKSMTLLERFLTMGGPMTTGAGGAP